jgi:hypothetical protein
MISAIALSWFVGFAGTYSFVENSEKSVENSSHLWKTAIRRTPDPPHSFLTGKMTSNLLTSNF